ncbi:MAG: NAD(P)-dependent alcohol dehydrogenase [Burkholderiales bacterium]|nr:NAD(P)-dependent alcohol dehydrogenase [Burkholderiales bacterium]
MQAVMYDRFGDESVLSLREAAVAQPARGEVQVRVRMASLNPIDFKLRSGILRMLGRPKRPAITGKDFAGEISALGAGVQGYKVGQRVFGSVDPLGGRGSCAQFVALSADLIALTPEAVSDEIAASLPVASGTALQSLTDIARLQAGQAILISGASGAVGATAVQLARSIGARITGVCGTANLDYVRSLGAERVIDYKTEDWLRPGQHFDVIFDAAAAASFAQARPLLTTSGFYINTMPRLALYWAALVARATSRQRCVPFLLKTDAALLARLAKLAAERVIVPHIQEIVDLSQVASAQRRMRQGKVHGKVCVRVGA